ncbi:hypothetical protein BROUX41_006193 [Berkeleyomyces rouxiae]|uniref:uncharacterized protein n=1 Tax=Berkeleyomyces rouxiae TaxID=2035830 RepID=UPI003B7FA9A9
MVSLNILATALLCSTAFAAYARTAADLDLKVNRESAGWVNVRDKDKSSFNAKILCEVSTGILEVSYLFNSGSKFKNSEALLAIWEDVTGTDAINVRYIIYEHIADRTTVKVLETIWNNAGINPEDRFIDTDIVYPLADGEMSLDWSSLGSTPRGSDVMEFCTDYENTDKLRMNWFQFGRTIRAGRWLSVNVSPWTPSLDN